MKKVKNMFIKITVLSNTPMLQYRLSSVGCCIDISCCQNMQDLVEGEGSYFHGISSVVIIFVDRIARSSLLEN